MAFHTYEHGFTLREKASNTRKIDIKHTFINGSFCNQYSPINLLFSQYFGVIFILTGVPLGTKNDKNNETCPENGHVLPGVTLCSFVAQLFYFCPLVYEDTSGGYFNGREVPENHQILFVWPNCQVFSGVVVSLRNVLITTA